MEDKNIQLSKESEIWIDEVQDLPENYLHAMIKLMYETQCYMNVVGDKLQSLEFKNNFLTEIVEEGLPNIVNLDKFIRLTIMNIDDNTLITSTKYKNIYELKNAPERSCKSVITHMKEGEIKDYMCKWAYEKFYLKDFSGNLTSRIKLINTNICYYHIINHCFDKIDPLLYSKTMPILNKECKSIIQSLHSINASATGIFIDYLIRRLISELNEDEFSDNRASEFTNIDEIINVTDKQLWRFNEIVTSDIGRWNIYEKTNIESKMLDSMYNGDRFIELSCENEWLKIEFKEHIGYVRYLIPDVEVFTGVSGNIEDYIPNKYFHKIDIDDNHHYCKCGCKMMMEQTMWIGVTEPIECKFPICQNYSYMKVKDTRTYKTVDILKELFIVSCCHTEAFGACPSQESFDKIIFILEELDKSIFLEPLISLCNELIKERKNIYLNPALGSTETQIPSDCDLVVDDILIDVKCTTKDNIKYEILQLLGYSSLLKYNDKYNIRINNVCILNLLKGECRIYNIEKISDENLLEYLNILTNKYDNSKEIVKKINDTEHTVFRFLIFNSILLKR